jgi:hypothetical protein
MGTKITLIKLGYHDLRTSPNIIQVMKYTKKYISGAYTYGREEGPVGN